VSKDYQVDIFEGNYSIYHIEGNKKQERGCYTGKFKRKTADLFSSSLKLCCKDWPQICNSALASQVLGLQMFTATPSKKDDFSTTMTITFCEILNMYV
jgi:hypothetical protein